MRPEIQHQRRTFRRATIALHVAALVAVFLVQLAANGFRASAATNVLIASLVLGMFLVVGCVVSLLIGRALLPRMWVAVAFIVPLISAIAIGGTGLAVIRALTVGQAPSRIKLSLEPPLAFDGSELATCRGDAVSGFVIHAANMGTLQGSIVSVTLNGLPRSGPEVPTPPPGTTADLSLSITLQSTAGTGGPTEYISTPDTQMHSDFAADGLSGAVTFEGLALAEPIPSPKAAGRISGVVGWNCHG